ncbi:sulfatase-like hydrolase/transferase [Membranihabitans maritimus]|uniref:sulfatase-like hydrolase/transferase n=1 Tax=Membranihabitans maritimus TaxID=2904244 RepID=UPI001F030004|nr:sulfatase-like hydrolase/transferase [Membranihabitans maritimus]
MKRNLFYRHFPFQVCLSVFILLFTFTVKSVAQEKPNIILIMADDLGYETLGCYGSDDYNTPNLDKMADEGMLFENCHSMPLCTPSRVQIMTGKYNFRNYVGFGILDPKEKTFGHRMQEEGYKTCIAGKWQLYGNDVQRKLVNGKLGSLPDQAGFDSYSLWQVKDRGFRYKSPTIDTKEKGLQTYPGEYGPDLFVDYIEDFMETNQDHPFFVYYPMCITHDPFLPTPFSNGFNSYDPEKRTNDAKYFGEMVNYMDHLVGRIIKKVESLDLSENTLILFVGDNGTDRDVTSNFQGQKLKGNKGYTNDLGTHVPLIAKWQGTIEPGVVNSHLIDFTDFVPTLLDVSMSEINRNQLILDGISFFPQLKGERKAETRDWIFCHYAPNWGKFEPRRYVFDTQLKLYENGEIYDLSKDLYETTPIHKSHLGRKQLKKIKTFESVLAKMNN